MYLLEEIMDYFLIKMHCSCFKYNELLHRLNVYKSSRKEYQVVDLLSHSSVLVGNTGLKIFRKCPSNIT